MSANAVCICTAPQRCADGDSRGGCEQRVLLEIAQDLHELLRRAGERPPYVLVGHSLGGLFVRKFAELYPRDVAGMVLLDSAHEDGERLRPPEVAAAWQPMRERIQAEKRRLDMSLVVFTATRLVKFDAFSDEAHAKFIEHHIAMDAELASRSPRGEHIVLDVNHGIHWDAPDAVIDAIRRVARSPQE